MIDFHCHLDLYPDPRSVVKECVARRMYILSVTTTPSAWSGTASLAEGSDRIRTALGLHPQLAHERKGELPLFETLIAKTKYVGEVGLDGSPEFKPHWADQIRVFGSILHACAEVGGRIMSIHSRRAATAVLDELEGCKAAGIPVLHWFSGSNKELERAVAMGCWFSVGPGMTMGTKGKRLLERIPREKVLTESDGPFAQLRGHAVSPWDVGAAEEALASTWKETPNEVRQRLVSNLHRLMTSQPDRS